ncbi:MAG: DUF58 domain-containing protein [Thermoleophilia bacterium]
MPTRKTGYWLFTALSLYAIAWNVGSGWLYILAALMSGAPVVSLALGRINIAALTLQQEVTGPASQGDNLVTSLNVVNGSHLPHFFLRLDGSYGGAAVSMLVPALKGRSAIQTRPGYGSLVRGVYAGGDYTISSSAPFGLIRSRRRRRVTCPLVVYPNWFQLANDWDTGHQNAGYVVSSTISTRQNTTDYLGVREYRSEDSQRSIHWRTTARAGRLSVIDYARQASMTPVILVDAWAGGLTGDGPDSTFETAVSIATSLVQRELLHNRRFGLGSSPADAAANGLGPDHDTAMHWLARIQADAEKPMDLQLKTLPWPTVTPVLILASHHRYATLADSEFLKYFPRAIVIMLDGIGFNAESRNAANFMLDREIQTLRSGVESAGGTFMFIRSVNEVRACLEDL